MKDSSIEAWFLMLFLERVGQETIFEQLRVHPQPPLGIIHSTQRILLDGATTQMAVDR
jgi:hypothetical protein